MTGLDNIINKINSDSAAKCDEIIEKARIQCEKTIAQANEAGKKAADKIISDAQKECENIASMAQSGAEQAERRVILSAKVEAVNETLAKLLSALQSMPEKEYFNALIKLAKENAMDGECVAELSAADMARLPSDFEDKLKAALAEKNSTCTLSSKSANISGGILLIYGDIEINCSFEAIIEANAESYKAKISEIIF